MTEDELVNMIELEVIGAARKIAKILRDGLHPTEPAQEAEAPVSRKVAPARARPPCHICEKVLDHLNKRLGRKWRDKKQIHACHKRVSKDEEVALDACMSVVNWLVSGWEGTDMEAYLRPSTIFRPARFLERWEDIQGGAPPPGKGQR